MLTTYLICLVSGGTLVLVTVAFGGDADSDVDIDTDVDVDMDLDADLDADLDVESDLGTSTGDLATQVWLPFFSLRFWIFASAFFGLTGTLLTYAEQWSLIDVLGRTHIAIIAGVMGLFAGGTLAYLLRYLQSKDVSSMVAQRDFLGRSAKVVVAIAPGGTGKIALSLNDAPLEMLAESRENVRIESGETVFIRAIHEGNAVVVRSLAQVDQM